MNNFIQSIIDEIKRHFSSSKIQTTKNCLVPFNSHVNVVVAINKYADNGKSIEYLYIVRNRQPQLTIAKKNNQA